MDQLTKDYKKLVRNAWRLFYLSHKAWTTSIEDAGLTTASFPVLEMIVQNPGITQQEITDQVSLDKSCTSRACKLLENQGYIRREKCLKSGHAFRCFPMDKAASVVDEIVQKESEHIHRLFKEETPAELEISIALLEQLIGRLKKE